MRSKKGLTIILSGALAAMTSTSASWAKGLEELSENSPENSGEDREVGEEGEALNEEAAEDEATETPGDVSPEGPEPVPTEPTPKEMSAASKALAGKLFLNTSFSWVIITAADGEWDGSGMSDVTVGYKLPFEPSKKMQLFVTYRYAPFSLAGTRDKHSYRGTWEAHYLGTRLHYDMNETFRLLGSVEAGFVPVYLEPTDNLDTKSEHEKNGGAFAIGFGADQSFAENFAFAAGPRVFASFGSLSMIQVGVAASFAF